MPDQRRGKRVAHHRMSSRFRKVRLSPDIACCVFNRHSADGRSSGQGPHQALGPDTAPDAAARHDYRGAQFHPPLDVWSNACSRLTFLHGGEDGTFVGARHYWGANNALWRSRGGRRRSCRLAEEERPASFSRRPFRYGLSKVRLSTSTPPWRPFFGGAVSSHRATKPPRCFRPLRAYAAGLPWCRPLRTPWCSDRDWAIWSSANTPSWSPSFYGRLDVRRGLLRTFSAVGAGCSRADGLRCVSSRALALAASMAVPPPTWPVACARGKTRPTPRAGSRPRRPWLLSCRSPSSAICRTQMDAKVFADWGLAHPVPGLADPADLLGLYPAEAERIADLHADEAEGRGSNRR